MKADSAVIRRISGTAVAVRGNDIDTDRIIPARYMKELTFDSLGQYSFYDRRFDESGNPLEHPFNDPRFRDASILLVNENFGCGSSREHAPQALMRWGIRAVVGESFAEIFAGNCTALGIPTLTLGREQIEALMQRVESDPQTEIRIDLEGCNLTAGDLSVALSLPDTQASMFLNGTWDTTTILLEGREQIGATAESLPYMRDFPYDHPRGG